MRKRLFLAAFLAALPGFAAGVVTQTLTKLTTPSVLGDGTGREAWVLHVTCTADAADGSCPATVMLRSATDGTLADTNGLYLYSLITDPGTPAPTDNYDITAVSSQNLDILGGAGADRDTTNTEQVAPGTLNSMFNGNVTFTVANNSVNSAVIVADFYILRQGALRAGGGSNITLPLSVANGGTGVSSLTGSRCLETNAGGTAVVVAAGACNGAPAFSAITSGTNTGAAMVVGPGASLTLNTSLTSTLGSLTGSSTPAFTSTATWNNAGTTFVHLFANVTSTASAAGSLLADLQVGGASKFKVGKGGDLTIADSLITGAFIQSGGIVYVGSGAKMIFIGRGAISPDNDGVFALQDNNQTSFSRLCIGPCSASFPALKQSSTGLALRLGNDSADTWVSALAYVAGGGVPAVGTCGTIGTGSKNAAGFITSGTTGACVSVVTFAGYTATTGWSCAISNATTANLITQTGSSTTTATFTGTTVSGDVLRYACTPY